MAPPRGRGSNDPTGTAGEGDGSRVRPSPQGGAGKSYIRGLPLPPRGSDAYVRTPEDPASALVIPPLSLPTLRTLPSCAARGALPPRLAGLRREGPLRSDGRREKPGCDDLPTITASESS